MPKVQLTLTDRESRLLSAKASQLGYSLVKYIKYLLSQEAEKAIEEGLVAEKDLQAAEGQAEDVKTKPAEPVPTTEVVEAVAQKVEEDAKAQLAEQGESLEQTGQVQPVAETGDEPAVEPVSSEPSSAAAAAPATPAPEETAPAETPQE